MNKQLFACTICINAALVISGLQSANAQGLSEAAGAGGLGAGAALGAHQAQKMSRPSGAAEQLNRLLGRVPGQNSQPAVPPVDPLAQADSYQQRAVQLEKQGHKTEAARLYAWVAMARDKVHGGRDQQAIKAYEKAAKLYTQAGDKKQAEGYQKRAKLLRSAMSGKAK